MFRATAEGGRSESFCGGAGKKTGGPGPDGGRKKWPASYDQYWEGLKRRQGRQAGTRVSAAPHHDWARDPGACKDGSGEAGPEHSVGERHTWRAETAGLRPLPQEILQFPGTDILRTRHLAHSRV